MSLKGSRRKVKVERPHWIVWVVAFFTIMWLIYG